MTRYIITKRKGAKKFTGAIPIKKSSRIDVVRRNARKAVGKTFTFRIVDESQLKKLISNQVGK